MKRNNRLVIIALIALCTSQILAWTSSKPQLECKTSVAWDAVMHYLSWKKYWYGTIDRESCYNRLIGKNIPVSFIYIPKQSKFAQRESTLSCDYRARSESNTESMLIIFSDTILQYNVVGELSNTCKPNAMIIPLDSDVNDICLPISDSKHIDERYKEDPEIIVYKENKKIPKIESYKIPSVVNTAVIKAVQRTMMNYIKTKPETCVKTMD
jgi:hypothetical protein